MDVTNVLSNRSSIDDRNISIKPDMNSQEQHKEALLLKERWSLIQSGVNKYGIKIKSSSVYVKGIKHEYVLNSVLHYTTNSAFAVPQTSEAAVPPNF